MMKRFLCLWMILSALLTALCVTASADSVPITVTYVPRSDRGTLFFLDVNTDSALSAAVLELRYDAAAMEYRSVDSDDDASVSVEADSGVVKIVVSDPNGIGGRLLQLSFKALSDGDTSVTLHTVQAIGADMGYLREIPDSTLSFRLGNEDVAAGAAADGGRSSATSAPRKTYGGSKSTSSGKRSSVDPDDEEDDDDASAVKDTVGEYRELSHGDSGKWSLLGSMATAAAILLVVLGIVIGLRIKKKRPAAGPADAPESDREDCGEETPQKDAEEDPGDSK